MKNPILWIAIFAISATVAAVAATPRQLDLAIENQRELAQSQPGDAGILNDLGNLLAIAGETDEAEEAYLRALDQDPSSVSAHFNLGLLHLRQGAERKALKRFQRTVELDPKNAWGHFQIGSLQENRGNDSSALDAYVKAFRLDPELSFADQNPQVIESKLVTEALLIAFQDVTHDDFQDTQTYENPDRILRLLMPSEREMVAAVAPGEAPPEEWLEEEAANPGEGLDESLEMGTGAGNGSTAVTRQAGGLDEGLSEPPAQPTPRVLTEQDLERGSRIGEAAPQGGAARRGGVRATPRNRGGQTTWAYPRESGAQRGVAQDRAILNRGRQPSANNTQQNRRPDTRRPTPSRPNTPRFRPGVRSTGSLELELGPDLEGLGAVERAG